MKPWQITLHDNNESLEKNLGITKERVRELVELVNKALSDDSIVRTSEVMQWLLEKSENPNEAAYLIFLVGECSGYDILRRKFLRKEDIMT